MAVAFVLVNYVDTAVHAASAGRALLVALLGALALQVVATAVLRNRRRGALAATVITGVTITWTPQFVLWNAFWLLDPLLKAVLLALMVMAAWLMFRLLIRRTLISAIGATRALDWFAVVLLLVVVFSGVTKGMLGQTIADLTSRKAPGPVVGAGPDIYLILLDGHPRADVLLERYGLDSQPLEEDLSSLGFEVAAESHSNYAFTLSTLASMFDMRYLDAISELKPYFAGAVARQPAWRNTINGGAALDDLRRRGYSIVAIGPPYEEVALRNAADEFDGAGYVNEFELHLLRNTYLAELAALLVPDWFAQNERDGIQRSLEKLRSVSARSYDGPRFVFLHLPTPHPPFVWGSHGEAVNPQMGSYGSTEGVAGPLDRILANEVEYIDSVIADAVGDLIHQAPRGSVVIVMSDHGFKGGNDTRDPATDADWRDWYGTLFAAYTPNAVNVFPDDISPVNLFPYLLNAYFDAGITPRPYRLFLRENEVVADR